MLRVLCPSIALMQCETHTPTATVLPRVSSILPPTTNVIFVVVVCILSLSHVYDFQTSGWGRHLEDLKYMLAMHCVCDVLKIDIPMPCEIVGAKSSVYVPYSY